MTLFLDILHFLQAIVATLLSGLLAMSVFVGPVAAWVWIEKESKLLAALISALVFLILAALLIPSFGALEAQGCRLQHSFCDDDD